MSRLSIGSQGSEGCLSASTSEKFWYKPNMTRDRAVQILKNSNPGDFIVRDSKSFAGSYGLCVRVEKHQVHPTVPYRPLPTLIF